MSDSVRPHRQKPTRLPRPWDSPGKNTGAGCHFLLQCMKVKSEREVIQSCLTLSDPMYYTAYQAPPSMGFSRQEYWSGVPLPSPPSYVVGTNYRVLIYYTCHFQGGSLCYSFFCLLVFSVFDFRPDTKRVVVDTFFRLTCSVALWGGRDAANE